MYIGDINVYRRYIYISRIFLRNFMHGKNNKFTIFSLRDAMERINTYIGVCLFLFVIRNNGFFLQCLRKVAVHLGNGT
jgi:hypothetical protein